jgi:hypothetical protein
MKLGTRIAQELERIAAANGGLYKPAAIVKAAKDPKSPLHDQFDWSDSSAAQKYRLDQARRLIRVHVVVTHEEHEPVRAFVSLRPDRLNGNGYRALSDVLKSKPLSQQLLDDALDELRAMRRKYATVQELTGVWDLVDEIDKKTKRAPARRAVKGTGDLHPAA